MLALSQVAFPPVVALSPDVTRWGPEPFAAFTRAPCSVGLRSPGQAGAFSLVRKRGPRGSRVRDTVDVTWGRLCNGKKGVWVTCVLRTRGAQGQGRQGTTLLSQQLSFTEAPQSPAGQVAMA